MFPVVLRPVRGARRRSGGAGRGRKVDKRVHGRLLRLRAPWAPLVNGGLVRLRAPLAPLQAPVHRCFIVARRPGDDGVAHQRKKNVNVESSSGRVRAKKNKTSGTAKNSWFVEACNGISKSDMDLATLATPGIPGSANIHDNDEDPDRACCRARGAPPRSDVCALPPPVCASRGCAAATIAPRGGAQHIIEPRPAHVWRRVRGRRKVEGSWHRAAHRRRGRGKLRAHHAPSRARVALPPHHSAAFAIAHEPASIKCVIMCGQRT